MRTHSLGAVAAAFACTAALASPLPITPDAVGPQRGPAQVVPDEALLGFDSLLVDTSARLAPQGDAAVVPLPLRLQPAAPQAGTVSFDGGGSREQLRSSMPVEMLAQPTAPQPRGRRNARSTDTDDAFVVDIAREEWFQQLAQSLLAPALRLETDEQGRRSVSLFGLIGPGGGDRSEFVFSPAEAQVPLQSLRPVAHRGANDGDGLFVPAEGEGLVGVPPLHEVVQWLFETASHPLSMLVYCIVAVYVLVWSMFSYRRTHPARARNRRRRKRDHRASPSVREALSKHRSRSSTRTREVAGSGAPSPSTRSERKRGRRRRRRSEGQAA